MTRRALLLGTILPTLGARRAQEDGFIASGQLQAENEPGYYSLNGAEAVTLMLSPELTPTLVRRAEALVGAHVEIVLRRR